MALIQMRLSSPCRIKVLTGLPLARSPAHAFGRMRAGALHWRTRRGAEPLGVVGVAPRVQFDAMPSRVEADAHGVSREVAAECKTTADPTRLERCGAF